MGKIGGGFVRALQEEQEGCVRIRAGANCIVRQQKFSKLGVEYRSGRFNLGKVEAVWRRISIAVEGGTIDARPKTRAGNFLAIRLASDRVRYVRHAARMRRRIASRKSGHRQVKAAPKQVDGAAFADKARAK